MSEFDISAAAGLDSRERRGTYFSLLPIELLEILNIHYYYPIKIGIINYHADMSMELIVERKRGNEIIDTITTELMSSALLAKKKSASQATYKGKDIDVSIVEDVVLFYIDKGNTRFTILYNEYETKVFFEKLSFIQAEIDKYRQRRLPASSIAIKLFEHSY